MHEWNVSPKEAVEIQKQLREMIALTPLPHPPKYIAGCDVSMNLFGKQGYAGFVVFSYPEMEIVDQCTVEGPLGFPYIPGLLSFREIPLLMRAWEGLDIKPDVIVVDGVGIAHPRRLGIASHLGLILNIPTIGCAKSVLTGTYLEPGKEQGAVSLLKDTKTRDILGAAVRSKIGTTPIFVSPGHKITLQEAVEIVSRTIKKHRLPEVTRLAHLAVNEFRLRASAA